MITTLWRKNPLIYEINTWVWLGELSQKHGRTITLGTVPDEELDALAAWHFDAIWLMGVWERSTAGRQIALDHHGLQEEYHHALPDFKPEDVIGSPYSVHNYAVDRHLGGKQELAAFRERLAARGLKLILDFVPNHVAVDHPWLYTHPEVFVSATEQETQEKPDYFFESSLGGHHQFFANGRDPYFPAWTDTAQLNAFNPVLRAKVVETLQDIATQCDGVRCDMAMLVTSKVFSQTWGSRVGQAPPLDYWTVVIPPVKSEQPNFLFIAEVYWDMEWDLLQQGFDYTYDKRLYDRLRNEPVRTINAHLYADTAYQEHMVRFIENHDEQRAAAALGPTRDLAAAVLIATLPGATLLHEGQMVGRQVKLPIQLSRRPAEIENRTVEAYYRMLLEEARCPVYHEGTWNLRDCGAAWDLNASHRSLITYTWRSGEDRRLVVVNYADSASQGRIPLPDFDLTGQKWCLHDAMHRIDYERDGNEIAEHGLYVDLCPWDMHVFSFTPLKPSENA